MRRRSDTMRRSDYYVWRTVRLAVSAPMVTPMCSKLTFIRRCREFGFSIDQVRSLVALVQDPDSSCVHARDLAQEHLVAVRSKLAELKALERSIAAFVANCDASCAGGPGPDCVILDDLSKGQKETSFPSETPRSKRSPFPNGSAGPAR